MWKRTAIALTCAVVVGACAHAAPIEVEDARIPMPAGPNAAVYFQLTNTGDQDAVLVGAESGIATAAIHETTMDGDMMKMEPIDELTIPAGQTVDFAPGGLHVMLMNVPAIEIGEPVSITLLFRDSEAVSFEAEVQPIETP
jgi:periplasmic copper chaperone A